MKEIMRYKISISDDGWVGGSVITAQHDRMHDGPEAPEQ